MTDIAPQEIMFLARQWAEEACRSVSASAESSPPACAHTDTLVPEASGAAAAPAAALVQTPTHHANHEWALRGAKSAHGFFGVFIFSSHFLCMLVILKIIRMLQGISEYKLEHRTTRRNDYTTGESEFVEI